MAIVEGNLRYISTDLSDFCPFAQKDRDTLSITEWYNGEGFDVNIDAGSIQETFSLTHGQFKALMHLGTLI